MWSGGEFCRRLRVRAVGVDDDHDATLSTAAASADERPSNHRARRHVGPLAIAVASGLLLSACAESVHIRSRPAGATVFVNGERVGKTPMDYSVARHRWTERYDLRVEKQGYHPQETVMATGVSQPRVAGGVASLGLLLFFKQPETFVEGEYLVDLAPSGLSNRPSRRTYTPRPLASRRVSPDPFAAAARREAAEARRDVARRLAAENTPVASRPATPAIEASLPAAAPKEPAPRPAPRKVVKEPVPEERVARTLESTQITPYRPEVDDQLAEIRILLDEGVIVQQEYEQMRAAILQTQ